MLAELRIVNFAIISDLDIVFRPGMNALLGETGAGKSIIVSALGLLTGRRAEFSKLKDETRKAFVEGTFVFGAPFIAAHPKLSSYLDGDRLVVSRILLPSKSAVARLNGESVPLSALREVMDGVIDIHSQGDSALLLDEKSYLGLIDRFSADGAAGKALETYSGVYCRLAETERARADFIKDSDLSQKDFLSYEAEEIRKAGLRPNEIEDLNEELNSLSGYEALQNAFKDFSGFYYGGEDGSLVSDVLSGLIGHLETLSDTPLKKEAAAALESAEELTDRLDGLFSAYGGLDFSPERLEQINARLFELSSLQHKYGHTTAEIMKAYDGISKRLSALDSYDDRLAEFGKQAEALRLELKDRAARLTELREKAAAGLSLRINRQLESLGLLAGGFRAEISPADPGPSGADKASFMICLNKGGRFVPLREAISGGENSRLTLALKSVLNALSPYDLLVFDEIDTGISGRIASKAAQKIYEISQSSMVLAITHLPQVVARAEHCYYVYKKTEGQTTESYIEPIEGKRVVEEIAKMMSGANVTANALQAAADLLASVASETNK